MTALPKAKASAGRLASAVMKLAMLGALGTTLAFGGQLGWRWAITSPTFAIKSIELRGNRRASAEELVRISGLVPGQNLFTADADAAEEAISGEPWVKTVEVHRRLPNTIVIRVSEREPALLVDLGKLYFADPTGALFKRARGGDDLDLPVVTGLSRQEFQDHPEQVEQKLRGLLSFVDAYRARSLDARYRLEELNLTTDDGLTLQLAPAGTKGELQTVKLGEAPFDEKLEKLTTLWDELHRRGLKAQVIHLENRTRPNWVAVKLAPQGAPSGGGFAASNHLAMAEAPAPAKTHN